MSTFLYFYAIKYFRLKNDTLFFLAAVRLDFYTGPGRTSWHVNSGRAWVASIKFLSGSEFWGALELRSD